MKQIYYTFCRSGASMSRQGGDQARAASDGISLNQADQMKSLSAYGFSAQSLIGQRRSSNEILQLAPVCLKFLMHHNSLAVVHTVYAQPDAQSGREGNYFTHLLLNIPTEITALDIISLWGSTFWQTADSDSITSPLPDVDPLDIQTYPRKITLETFGKFLQENSENEALFAFLLNAWLCRDTSKGQRIILVAPPEKIAFALWGIMKCLPHPLWKDMTFSTYEQVSRCPCADIVGFWSPIEFSSTEESVLNDFMSLSNEKYLTWRTSREVASSRTYFDTKKGYLSPFTQPILTAAKKGDIESIQSLFANYPHECLAYPKQLEWLYKISHQPTSMSATELAQGLANPHQREYVARHSQILGILRQEGIKRYTEEMATNSNTLNLLLKVFSAIHSDVCNDFWNNIFKSDRCLLIPMMTHPPAWSVTHQQNFLKTLWSNLLPASLTKNEITFLRPYAKNWFDQLPVNEREAGIERWFSINNIEELREAIAKINLTTEKGLTEATDWCVRFSYPAKRWDEQRLALLATQIPIFSPRLMARVILELIANSKNLATAPLQPPRILIQQIKFQHSQTESMFWNSLVEYFKRFHGEMINNLMFNLVLNDIVRKSPLHISYKLLFHDVLSESLRDTMANMILENYKVEQLRDQPELKHYLLSRLTLQNVPQSTRQQSNVQQRNVPQKKDSHQKRESSGCLVTVCLLIMSATILGWLLFT